MTREGSRFIRNGRPYFFIGANYWVGPLLASSGESGDWEAYHDYTKVMFTGRRAQEYFLHHVKNIVSRVNSVTGKAYRDDPAIFSWQIGNEPRAFFEELHPQFIDLLHETARTIRDIDPNHMINHLEVAKKLGKPLVIEEFGLIRDEGALDPDSPVAGAVTIEQAASYASKGKKAVVVLHGGEYDLDSAICIKGAKGITVKCCKKETAILDGSISISNWPQESSTGIWKASLTETTKGYSTEYFTTRKVLKRYGMKRIPFRRIGPILR